MGIIRKLTAIALVAVMAQSVAVTSLAVSNVDTVASSATSASTTKTYSLKLNFGQSKMVSDVVYIPCRATYSCSGTCVGVTTKGQIIAYRSGGGTVVAKGDNGITYKINVTVSGNPTSITLNKSSVTDGVGRSFTLVATVPNFSSNYNLSKIATWSSSDTTIATVSQQGVVSCKKKGTATITVKTYNGKTATCKVNVKPAPTAVKLDKTSVALAKGYTYALAKIYTPSDACMTATWKSSNTSVATVSSKGVITAKSVGTATITVATYNGKTATCKVTVKPDPTTIKLDKSSVDLAKGYTYALAKIYTPSDAYTSATWKSSNTAVATVSSKGVVTAKSDGTATITVTTYNGKTATCKVTVKPDPTAVKLNKTSLTLETGKTYTLIKSFTPSNAYPKVTWKSSNTSVATVSATGVVTAKTAGTATITVTTYNGKTATCKVTVSAPETNFVDEVIRLVNIERAKENLPALKKDTQLCQFANTRAEETSVSFSHTRPDGRSCFSILKDNNYSYRAVGENIAAGQATPAAVVDGWMHSEGHRANIMNPDYTKIGVGYYYSASADYRHYWTQLFAG